jgi:hypothetical protein
LRKKKKNEHEFAGFPNPGNEGESDLDGLDFRELAVPRRGGDDGADTGHGGGWARP